MSEALNKLKELGLKLPELPASNTAFNPYMISGNQIFISGQLPLGYGDINKHVGRVGEVMGVAAAQEIAKLCALNVLKQANDACGGLDKAKCIKLTVFVNSDPTFIDQPKVANAASELINQVLGIKGHHARSAIGVSQLPFGVAVEIEAIFEMFE